MVPEPSSAELVRETNKQYWRILGPYVAGGLIAFVAIAGGIYFGFSYAIRDASGNSALANLNQSFLNPGDSLPNYRVRDLQSFEQKSLSSLIQGRPAVIIFVNSSCGVCETMASYWTQKVLPQLRDDIRVVTISDEQDYYADGNPAKTHPITGSHHAVSMDREQYRDLDGISTTPTAVVVTAAGQVKVVTSGFSRLLTAELLNHLF